MVLMVVFGFWLIVPVGCAILASSKGRSELLWFIAGFFFNIIALIIIAGMPARYEPSNHNGVPRIKGHDDRYTVFSKPGLVLLLIAVLLLTAKHYQSNTTQNSQDIWNKVP